MNIAKVETTDLRTAAAAWRTNDENATRHWFLSGPLRWLMVKPDLSIHDRIDDLLDEIERLRA